LSRRESTIDDVVILVADDDGPARHLVVRYLEKAGYQAAEAATGKEALAVLAAGGVDLVITDMYMPDVDGIELIVRSKREVHCPRFIAMSGGGQHTDTETVLDIAVRLGAAAVLSKPFTQEELLNAVRSAMA
jgi:CheY-like chemotaxis protein